MRATLIAVVTMAALAWSSAVAQAAPGALDPSFGTGGRVVVSQGVNGVAIQPDGKIVIVGWDSVGTDTEMAITRLNPDGSTDMSFGTGGTTLVAYNGSTGGGTFFDIGNAVALQADGKIVVAGQTNSGSLTIATVVRLNADGSLDTSFQDPGIGAPGIVPFRIGEANAVAIDQSGAIVVAGGGHGVGQTDNNSFVDRFHSDGSQDTTFDQFLNLGGDNSFNGVALQPDGKIVAVGYANPALNTVETAARILANGQLDTTFGTGGTVTFGTIGGSDDSANALAIQPDGGIDVAGSGGGNGDFTFARLTAAGHLDSTVNGGQPVTVDFGGTGDSANAIALLGNGKIMLAGDGNLNLGVARLQPTGMLDTTFGNGGQATISFPAENSYANAMAVQPDGRVVLAGIAGNGGAVIRLLGDPVSTGGGPVGGGTGGPGSAGAQQGKVALFGFRVAPLRFRAARRGRSIASRRAHGTGTRIGYYDPRAARTTFTVLSSGPGVRSTSGRCVKRSRHRAHRRHCLRLVTIGRFAHSDHQGANSFVFTGRIHNRRLAPGTYELRTVARAAGGASPTLTTPFRIIR